MNIPNWDPASVRTVNEHWPEFCAETLKILQKHFDHPGEGTLAICLFLALLARHSVKPGTEKRICQGVMETVEWAMMNSDSYAVYETEGRTPS